MDQRTADPSIVNDRPDARAQFPSAALPRSIAAEKTREDYVPRGILCMVLATMLFSTAAALTKWLVGIYPVGEVVFARSLTSFVVCAAFMLPMTGLAVYATRRPRDHLARGLSQATSQTLFALAFTLMPLAGAVSINSRHRCSPLWCRFSGSRNAPISRAGPRC